MTISNAQVQVLQVEVRTATGMRRTPINSLFNSLALLASEDDGPEVKVRATARSSKTGKSMALNGTFKVVGGESVRGRNGGTTLTLRGPKGDAELNWKDVTASDEFEPVGIVPTPTTARKRVGDA